ncbi:hypothetical protein BJX76DRAFT_354529 [Aspergillus varians]
MAVPPFSMTAIFAPPSPCSTSWTYEPKDANDVDGGSVIQNAVTFAHLCFLSNFSQVGRRQASLIYSPGWCPMGYSSADVAIDGEVTTPICYFGYHTNVTEHGDGGLDNLAGCISILPTGNSTIIPVRQETTATRVIGPVTMWAQPITVALESSDSSLFVSPTTSSTASVASETGTTTESESESSPTSPSKTQQSSDSDAESAESSSGGGLSTGAGIGIGVGVGVGGFAVLAAVGLWLWRSRSAKKGPATIERDAAAYGQPTSQYYGETVKLQSWPTTLEEMDGSNGTPRRVPQELA